MSCSRTRTPARALPLLVVLAICFSAGTAGAFAIGMRVSPSTGVYQEAFPQAGELALGIDLMEAQPAPLSRVTVELFLDADRPGIQALSVALLFESSALQYVPQSNASAGVPSYILYGAGGMGLLSWMVPTNDPWQTWPTPPSGFEQVMVGWIIQTSVSGEGTYATGFGIKIAEIVLEWIGQGDLAPNIILSTVASGTTFLVKDEPGASLDLYLIPEPATALLVGLGLTALALGRKRRLAARTPMGQ